MARVLTTLRGFYAQKNPRVTVKQCTLEITAKLPCHICRVRRRRRAIKCLRNRSVHMRTELDLGAERTPDAWTGRMLVGISVVDRRGSGPWRHPFVNLVKVFRLGKATDLVGRLMRAQHCGQTHINNHFTSTHQSKLDIF